MKILLYSINFAPELTGIGKYSGEMVQFLVEQGHDVTVIAAPPYYPHWKVVAPYHQWMYQVENIFGAKVIRCPLYVPKTPRTLTRLVHLLSFSLSSFFAVLAQIFKKNDVIIMVEPTFVCAPVTLLFAKLTGAKSWLHIQDFEIEAMFGLGMAPQVNDAKSFIYPIESWLMQKFDRVSSISHSMLRHSKEFKGVADAKLIFFPNWSDVDCVHPEPNNSYFRQKWNVSNDDFIVLYSGNIGKKQGLEIVIKAAQHFHSQGGIKFIIVGDGAHKSILEALAKGLDNVLFKPLQSREDLSLLLACADVHLVIQKAGAADLVLPSKLTNILAAGGSSIITAEKGTELGDFCENNSGIARRIDPENVEELIDAIIDAKKEALELNTDKKTINYIARNYAEKFISKTAILHQFENDLAELFNKGPMLASANDVKTSQK